jgi:tRNA A-37 threonylcarbamoyl transferase component Bud32
MSTLVGMMLSGRYRLDARIGSGGMSTVYRAFDQTLERQVAIKLLHRQIADDPDQLERFRREARAVAQLSHPHIVTVIDAGEEEGRPYIVFEYVPGETLKELIKREGPLDVDEAAAYAIEIARALGYAHGRNIVHRDVKPQNVLIDDEGSAKITDFGIARTLDEEGLTADGRVLGTTDYVSPEQALGHQVTGQSDIYSLGVVLFEMLTGDVPFRGENQVAVAMKHVREPLPDVQELRPEVSATLAAVVDRATAKDLERRYESDEGMVDDLEEALAIETARSGHSHGEATSVLRTLPQSKQRRIPLRLRHPLWIVALLLLVGGVVVAVLALGADQTTRGTGTQGAPREAPGLEAVSLGQGSAAAYDPLGDRAENNDQARFAVDRDKNTTWSTERYDGGVLNKPTGDQPGVGLVIDAKPKVAARRMRILTTTPGWSAEVYASESRVPPEWGGPDWVKVATSFDVVKDRVKVDLDTADKPFRYYLIWITKVPPEGKVSISEVYLYRQK